jgi:hypothetical protein
MTDDTDQRLALYQRLVSLPPSQFQQVLFSHPLATCLRPRRPTAIALVLC